MAEHDPPEGVELDPGTRVGRWTLGVPLGSGAFGTTWTATRDDGRPGALKVLDSPPGDELRALASVCHPAVVAVLDGGGAPVPYLVMELARGGSLRARLDAASLEVDDATQLFATLADAMAAVHGAGITHGDLKPANVIVGDGSAWVVDFGMAGARGGSASYAAPERAQGGATPASDVYALGLVFWECLHGSLPWTDWGDRARDAPQATTGPAWLAELLGRMLAVAPAHRPQMTEVADTLSTHGALLPVVGADLLRRRAVTVSVGRPDVDPALSQWLARGGVLGVSGPAGSGRTHALDHLATELRARGRPWLRFQAGLRAWGAVQAALADPVLGAPVALPLEQDPRARAAFAAAALVERSDERLAILVDDLHEVDVGSQDVLGILASTGEVDLFVCTGDAFPDWVTAQHALRPLTTDGVDELLRGVLGAEAELGGLVACAMAASEGVPGRVVDVLCAALEAGALVQRAHRWLVDDRGLASLEVPEADASMMRIPLSPAAAQVGAGLALAGGQLPIGAVADAVHMSTLEVDLAVDELVSLGLAVREGDQASTIGRSAEQYLASIAGNAREIHRRFAGWRLRHPIVSYPQVGWHLVGAGDLQLAAELGERCVQEAIRQDAEDAARLAEALYALAPSPVMMAAQVDALAAAGHLEDALVRGKHALSDPPTRDEVPVLVATARALVMFGSEWDQAIAMLDQALDVAGPEPSLALLQVLCTAQHRAGRWLRAIEVAQRAADRPAPTRPPEIAALHRIYAAWAFSLEKHEGIDAALQLLDGVSGVDEQSKAGAMLYACRGLLLYKAGRLHDAAEQWQLSARSGALAASSRARHLVNIGSIEYHQFNVRRALASWERAALLFDRLNARRDIAIIQNNLGQAYGEVGRWERAFQAAARSVSVAREVGQDDVAAMCLGSLGDLHFARHEFPDARKQWAAARECAVRAGSTEDLVELARRESEADLEEGRADAREHAASAVEMAEAAGHVVETCRARAVLARCAAQEGDGAEVERLFDIATGPLQEAGEARALAIVRLHMSEALRLVGQVDRARDCIERVVAYADEVGNSPLRTRADAIVARMPRAAEVDSRLNRLLDLAVAVARERHLPTLLDAISSAALDLLEAERSFVLLVREGDPVVVASTSVEEAEGATPSMTIVRRALSQRREVIAGDLGERGDLRGALSVVEMDLRSVLCVPLIDGGDVMGAIYVDSRWTTEQQWAEAARLMRGLAAHAAVAVANARHIERAVARAERAADIAHDLSSPAHVVLSIADELTEDEDALPHEIARDLRGVGDLIVSMRTQFLRDAGPDKKHLPLADVLESLSSQLARVARRGGAVLALDVTGDAWLECNAHELERAISNLVRNAVRFSPPGGTVNLSSFTVDDVVAIEVRDRGPGIPETRVATLFERGVQALPQETGHGLGLAIAKRVVEDHGGNIGATNHPDGGAVFRITLPLVPAQ